MTPSELAATVGAEIVALPESLGVIFPEGHGWTWDNELFPYWTPTREVVIEAESRLADFLCVPLRDGAPDEEQRCHRRKPRILARLPQYLRQYSGIVFDTRPALYINCFLPDRWHDHWPASPVEVCDGGDAYFQLIYRPEEKDFVRFYVNGEA